ncbi:CSD-domain-containing protein [Ramicandelaber brevisporus]|nr:CSD-domain-containing protein [Ramicandelaber brevisporus]
MEVTGGRKSGLVKYFDQQKGFGFIISDDPTDASIGDVFVHYTVIHNEGGFKCLADGEQVEYEARYTEKGLSATIVTGPGGASVRGDPRGPSSSGGGGSGGTSRPKHHQQHHHQQQHQLGQLGQQQMYGMPAGYRQYPQMVQMPLQQYQRQYPYQPSQQQQQQLAQAQLQMLPQQYLIQQQQQPPQQHQQQQALYQTTSAAIGGSEVGYNGRQSRRFSSAQQQPQQQQQAQQQTPAGYTIYGAAVQQQYGVPVQAQLQYMPGVASSQQQQQQQPQSQGGAVSLASALGSNPSLGQLTAQVQQMQLQSQMQSPPMAGAAVYPQLAQQYATIIPTGYGAGSSNVTTTTASLAAAAAAGGGTGVPQSAGIGHLGSPLFVGYSSQSLVDPSMGMAGQLYGIGGAAAFVPTVVSATGSASAPAVGVGSAAGQTSSTGGGISSSKEPSVTPASASESQSVPPE